MEVLVIPTAIIVTAVISGTFGLGGGMLLMGVYAALFDVPEAMVLHGVTQLSSNVSRVWLLRGHVHMRLLPAFALGAVSALGLCLLVQVSLNKASLYFALGALPLAGWIGRRFTRLEFPIDITRAGHGFVGATVVATLSLMFGSSGPIMDMLFARSQLDRFAVVATKAANAILVHVVKILFWTSLAVETAEVPSTHWLLGAAILLPPIGSGLGRSILIRLREVGFRRYTEALILTIGCVYLARAINLAFFS